MMKAISKDTLSFDFKNLYFLPPSSLQSLSYLHQQFALSATEKVSALLHCNPKIILIETIQQPFSLFMRSYSPASFHTLIDLSPLPGQGVITLNLDLCYFAIDKLLGGSGTKPSVCHPFNDLEMAIQRKFIQNLLDSLKAVWKSVLETEFAIAELSYDPRKNSPILGTAKCVIFNFLIQLSGFSTLFSIVIPSQSLQNLDTIPNHEISEMASALKLEESIDIDYLQIELKALLGSIELTPSELEMLQVNDVIKLNTNINHPLSLLVQDQPIFLGLPGLLHAQKGVLLL